MAESISGAVHEIIVEDGDRLEDLDAWESIYNDRPCEHFGNNRLSFFRDGKSRMPVLAGMVDATVSRIGRARPLPTVLTTNGDFKAKRRARLKTRWLQGMFKKMGIHQTMKAVLRDALVLGTGVAKTFYDAEAEEIRCEHVWPGYLFVHKIEAKHGCIRSLYQVMAVDRQTLADRFPESKRYILDSAKPPLVEEVTSAHADLVEVIEAWRIGTKTTPGKHAIVCGNEVLFEEDWDEQRFPFEFLHWRNLQREFWGQGMVESGAGLQSMINDTARTMEECFRFSFPFMAYDKASGFPAESLSNQPGMAYPVNGSPSQQVAHFTPPPFSEAYYRYLEMLVRKLFETQGVSELAASSSKPSGLNSGKALLVFQDVESERFLVQGRAYEELHVSLAERVVAIAERLVKDGTKSEALRALGGQKALEAIQYEDVRFADRPWEVQVFPVTSLSHTPSGRLQQIQEMLQMGIIPDPAVARELLDYPDFDRFTSVESARRELVEKCIDTALDRGEVKPPNPYMDLQYAMRRGVLEINLAQMEGAPEKSLQALRDFVGAVESQIARQQEQAAMEAQQAQAAAGAAAGGAPVPPPAAAPLPEIPNLAAAGGP